MENIEGFLTKFLEKNPNTFPQMICLIIFSLDYFYIIQKLLKRLNSRPSLANHNTSKFIRLLVTLHSVPFIKSKIVSLKAKHQLIISILQLCYKYFSLFYMSECINFILILETTFHILLTRYIVFYLRSRRDPVRESWQSCHVCVTSKLSYRFSSFQNNRFV